MSQSLAAARLSAWRIPRPAVVDVRLTPELIRRLATVALALATFATFFIVEHSLFMSLTSEHGDDAAFVESDLDADAESGSALRKVGFLAFGAVGLGLLAFRGPSLNWRDPICWCAVGLFLWIVASPLWAADTGLSIRRVIVIATIAAGVAGTLRILSPLQATDLVGWTAVAFVALGIVCEVVLFQFRPWESGYRLSGTTHPNTLGILCAIASFFGFTKFAAAERGRRNRWLALACVAFVALFLTKSRTALGATVIALFALAAIRGSWPQRALVCLGGVGSVAAILLLSLILQIDSVSGLVDAALLGRGEEVTTLTGRIPLWAELNRDIAERPLTGYGFGSFWTPDVLYRVRQNQGWQIPHAHSGYYELMLNVGFVGTVFVLVACAISVVRTALASACHVTVAGMAFCIVVFAGIYSLTDTAFALPTYACFALAVVTLQATRLPSESERLL